MTAACLKEETMGNTGSPDGAKAWFATGTPRGAGRAVRGGGEARSSEETG